MKITKQSDMPFWNHVDELRSRLIKSLFTVILFTLIAYYFSDIAIYFLAQPKIDLLDKINLQVLKITSMFMAKIYISMLIGFIFSMPFILFQIWSFVSPAISKKMNFSIFFMFIMSSVFFVIGSFFAYEIIVPLSISFFTSLTSSFIPVDYNITLENFSLIRFATA